MKKLTIKILIIFFVNMFWLSPVQSQNSRGLNPKRITQKERKAILKSGDSAYKDFKYSIAANFYEKYFQTVAEMPKAVLLKLADCYWKIRNYDDASRVYNLLYSSGSEDVSAQIRLRIAELFARSRDYKQASKWLNGLAGYELKASAYINKSDMMSMRRDSLNWHLGLLNVNTAYNEFTPFLADSVLYFSSDRPDRNKLNIFEGIENNYARLWKIQLHELQVNPIKILDSYQTRKQNIIEDRNTPTVEKNKDINVFLDKLYTKGDTCKGATLVSGFNIVRYNVGAVSVDKNNHFYFSANYSKSDKVGTNRLRLMEGICKKNGYLKMKELPFGERDVFSVMHPAINRDGTFLVFSSDEPKGKGGYDLYYAQRKSVKQAWGEPKIFSDNVNTVGNDVFPTLTPDGYLYFSSDALPGLGGLDIYKIKLQVALDGKLEPEHLSYPINSAADDFGWTQDSTGINGYFSSDRLNNNNDLYSFYYKEPVKMYSVEDKVVDIETMKPIENVTLFLFNKQDGKVYISKTNSDGKYHFEVPDANKGVIVRAMRKGFSSFCLPVTSELISQSTKSTVSKATQYFALEKLKINYAWKLGNIYYQFNKSELSDEAKPILDSLISVLRSYPITVEISSHTDSRGTAEYNQRLSQRRSESVVNYIVERGIDSTRLIAKGFGKSRLINRCVDGVQCTEAEHQANRRTEVKILDYDVEQKSPIEEVNPDNFKQDDVVNPKALPVDFFDECAREPDIPKK
jgi:hypothetical protein